MKNIKKRAAIVTVLIILFSYLLFIFFEWVDSTGNDWIISIMFGFSVVFLLFEWVLSALEEKFDE